MSSLVRQRIAPQPPRIACRISFTRFAWYIGEMPSSETEVAILERVIHPERGDLSREASEALLKLDFDKADHARMAILSLKAQDGTLSAAERAELERYINVDYLLAFLQSKARTSLKPRNKRPRR
jgi:hypothetical protein